MKISTREELEQIDNFGIGEENRGFAKYFVGKSYLKILSKGIPVIANVTFELGCRNFWHSHRATKGGGQILICTAGEGWYQEEGKKALSLHPGSIVEIPANVKHWHGAKVDSWFSHIAIEVPGEGTTTDWFDKVDDRDYKKLESKNSDKSDRIIQTAGRNILGSFAPDFAHYNDDVLFGENWNNGDISLKTRSIITVVALMSQGITDFSLRSHLINAKNNGVTKEEIVAIITHTAFYAGWPKAWAAFNIAKELWGD